MPPLAAAPRAVTTTACVHLDLDGAWPRGTLARFGREDEELECRAWGPRLRFCAPQATVEAFYREVAPHLAPFILFGSGDYHYLAALWLRRLESPFTLVSFDNHPDWDIRPPRWACGSWLDRALEMPNLERASVWGCGNFELEWPNRLFAHRRGLASGRLEVHPWAGRLKPATARRWNAMTPATWRDRFARFARTVRGRDVYVTVDLDCLQAGQAATNWENGLLSTADVAWALRQLREAGAEIVGGDLCGAYSPPAYERWTQRFASNFDHPKLTPLPAPERTALNLAALDAIWPELTGAGVLV